MGNEFLKKLHDTELIILDEIDRICNRHNIDYLLGYGTLLGAVRHKGFIPWDDDMDLFMTRSDFNRFSDACAKELDERFFLHTIKTDERYPLTMMKVRLKDTLFLGKENEVKLASNGIWIDIFILEDVPREYSWLQKIQFSLVGVINLVKGCKVGWYSKSNLSVATKIAYFFLKTLKLKALDALQEKVSTIFSKKECDYLVDFAGCYGVHKQTFEKAKLFPKKYLTFEGRRVPVPNDYEGILTHIYGSDYMTLPPEEKRRTHHPVRIDFGPYA